MDACDGMSYAFRYISSSVKGPTEGFSIHGIADCAFDVNAERRVRCCFLLDIIDVSPI